MIYYQDPNITIHNGHALDVLSEMPEESIQCVITSPPYWGLRKYDGNQDRVWGGDPECEHDWQPNIRYWDNRAASLMASEGITDFSGKKDARKTERMSDTCQKCGAWEGQFGLEPTPQMYVQHSIEFLRAIWRVLREDGVVFWNIGDSYAGSGCGTNDYRTPASRSINKTDVMYTKKPPQQKANLRPKSLCLVPQRLAIATQEDGWIVRQNIIWSKPNPMPESVKDRPTTSHEYILMLTKSGNYYWDQEAVKEQGAGNKWGYYHNPKYGEGTNGEMQSAKEMTKDEYLNKYEKANIRSVWNFRTQPYPEAHFAVFPEELPKRCILAATKEGDTVLDLFAGTGTTGVVAKRLNRFATLADVSGYYCQLIRKRVSKTAIPMKL